MQQQSIEIMHRHHDGGSDLMILCVILFHIFICIFVINRQKNVFSD